MSERLQPWEHVFSKGGGSVTSVPRIPASLHPFDTAFLWHFPFRLSVSWQVHFAIHIWPPSQYIVVLYLVVLFYTPTWLDSVLVLTKSIFYEVDLTIIKYTLRYSNKKNITNIKIALRDRYLKRSLIKNLIKFEEKLFTTIDIEKLNNNKI